MKGSCKIWFFVWTCLFNGIEWSLALNINKDGGYENIVIAVSSTIEEEPPLLANLKTLIRGTSELLYKSTRNCFHFKNVTILIPSTWKNTELEPDKPQLHQQAEVRIVPTRTAEPQQPFIATQQPRGCGEVGDFIQIETNFFKNTSQEYSFLQHWARLRFGIFEEAGIPSSEMFPPVYRSADGWKLTGCEHPYPWKYNSDAGCSPKVPDTCQFELQNGAKVDSSIMSTNEEVKATVFCSSEANSLHNVEAPTPQNAFCQQKSTWEVIKNSKDYKKTTCSTNPAQALPNVKIEVKRRGDIKTVIVVDPNLCQFDKSPKIFKTVALSVSKALEYDFKKDGIRVLINTQEVINRFYSDCRNNRQTERSFYDALVAAAQQNVFTNILLIMDGTIDGDSAINRFLTTTTELFHLHIINYPPRKAALPYTTNSDKVSLHNIPEDNQTESSCDLDARIRFDQVFDFIFGQYKDNFDSSRHMIRDLLYSKEPQKRGELIFSITSRVSVVVYLCSKEDLSASITWNENHSVLDQNEGCFKNKEPLETKTPKNTYMLSFQKVDSFGGYALTFWIDRENENVQFLGSVDNEIPSQKTPPILRVTTTLKNPVVTADVFELNGMTLNQLMLKKTPMQGISHVPQQETYSVHFVALAMNPAAYSVVFTATDSQDAAQATYKMKSFASFSTTMTSNDVIYFPPSRIVDFRIKQLANDAVTFRWTAPGARYDNGKVKTYHLRCGNTVVSNNNIEYLPLSVTPSEAGSEDNYQWTVPAMNTRYFCSLKTDPLESSPASNTVLIFLDPNLPTVTPSANSSTEPLSEEDPDSNKAGIIGGAVGGVLAFLVICVILGIVIYHRRKLKAYVKTRQTQETTSANNNNNNNKPMDYDPEHNIIDTVSGRLNHRTSSRQDSVTGSEASYGFNEKQYQADDEQSVDRLARDEKYNQQSRVPNENQQTRYAPEDYNDDGFGGYSTIPSKWQPRHQKLTTPVADDKPIMSRLEVEDYYSKVNPKRPEGGVPVQPNNKWTNQELHNNNDDGNDMYATVNPHQILQGIDEDTSNGTAV